MTLKRFDKSAFKLSGISHNLVARRTSDVGDKFYARVDNINFDIWVPPYHHTPCKGGLHEFYVCYSFLFRTMYLQYLYHFSKDLYDTITLKN